MNIQSPMIPLPPPNLEPDLQIHLSNSATFIPYKLNQKDNLSPAFRKAFTNELLLVIIRSVIIHDSVKENIIP